MLAWRGALLRLDGDTGLLLELAALFIDDGPQLMQTLYEALDADDLPASQRAVHSLQGVLVNFGAQRDLAGRADVGQPARTGPGGAVARPGARAGRRGRRSLCRAARPDRGSTPRP
ncbi:Hpt domain-containing protein [Massilia sp. B-10]|nr:Hpt domain-containing protein [Massilia sp. B-10]